MERVHRPADRLGAALDARLLKGKGFVIKGPYQFPLRPARCLSLIKSETCCAGRGAGGVAAEPCEMNPLRRDSKAMTAGMPGEDASGPVVWRAPAVTCEIPSDWCIAADVVAASFEAGQPLSIRHPIK